MKKTSVVSKLYMGFIFLFLYAPIIVMMVFSFNSSSSTYQMSGFSLYWWKEMFADSAAMLALKNTIILAVCSAVISP